MKGCESIDFSVSNEFRGIFTISWSVEKGRAVNSFEMTFYNDGCLTRALMLRADYLHNVKHSFTTSANIIIAPLLELIQRAVKSVDWTHLHKPVKENQVYHKDTLRLITTAYTLRTIMTKELEIGENITKCCGAYITIICKDRISSGDTKFCVRASSDIKYFHELIHGHAPKAPYADDSSDSSDDSSDGGY